MMDIFTSFYFAAIVIEIFIRAPFKKMRKQEKMSKRRITTQEKAMLGFLWLGIFAVPIIYAFNWLGFADYNLPVYAGWTGVIITAEAIIIFWRAHTDLGLNWSPSLEIRAKHELITRGIYGIIRHPMYASQWLWVIAQPLLLQNWVAGFLDMIVFIPFYFLRVKSEEKMILDEFGVEYRAYTQRVGSIFPRFK